MRRILALMVLTLPVLAFGEDVGEGRRSDKDFTQPLVIRAPILLHGRLSKSESGKAATIRVGRVETGLPGTAATVRNSGTEAAAVLDFVIPRGQDGADGRNGQDGQAGTAEDVGPLLNRISKLEADLVLLKSMLEKVQSAPGAEGRPGKDGQAGHTPTQEELTLLIESVLEKYKVTPSPAQRVRVVPRDN